MIVTFKCRLKINTHKYKYLFSGKLRTVPGPPVELKLKRDIIPFYSPSYTIPHIYTRSAKQETDDLYRTIDTELKAPSFFRKKRRQNILCFQS